MERRNQPRVQLPLEIELTHPFVGHKAVIARDMSDEGVYAWYPNAPFKVGSSMEVTLLGNPMVESRPTPTVRMTVARIDETGIALTFANKSGAHLWRSAGKGASELEIGRDLFRVFQAAVVRDIDGRLLTVQQNGRWLFPGAFLHAAEHWQEVLQQHLASTLNLTDSHFLRTVLTHCNPEVVARESSTMSVFHLFETDLNQDSTPAPDDHAAGTPDPDKKASGKKASSKKASGKKPSGKKPADKKSADKKTATSKPGRSPKAQLVDGAPYTKLRWIESHRQLDELSFSAEPLRELARDLLRRDDSARGPRASEASTREVLRKHG